MKILSLQNANFAHFNVQKTRGNQKLKSIPNNSLNFNCSAINHSNLSSYHLSPISFGIKLSPGAKIYKVEKDLEKELELSQYARRVNISTPKISEDGTYTIKGEKANYQRNPITKGHIKQVMDNLFLMDKNNLFHGDIEKTHVFYNKNSSKVEFDCFRFGCQTDADSSKDWMNWEFPKEIYPTNIMQYENNCLGDYLNQMNSEEEKVEFLKTYLSQASEFHKNRFNYLSKINAPTEQIEYDKARYEAYKNPDNELVRLIKKRIEFKYGERLAFTKIDEGRGACGHQKDENLVIQGIEEYFNAIYSAIEYIDELNKVINDSTTSLAKKNCLKKELIYANHWLNNYIISTKGNALYSLNPDNKDNKTHTHISQEKRDELERMFILLGKADDNIEKINLTRGIKKYYKELTAIK